MSIIQIAAVKESLRIIHNGDDAELQRQIDSAESEIRRMLNLDKMTGFPELHAAVCLLVRSRFDEADSAEIARLRSAAETLVWPYRVGMGV